MQVMVYMHAGWSTALYDSDKLDARYLLKVALG